MIKALRVALPVLILTIGGFTLPRRGTPQNDQALPGAGPRTLFAPYYAVEPGFQTMLALNNSTRAAFIVKPTLYSLDGKPAAMNPIRLNAHDTKGIDIALWVAELGNGYAVGSVRLDYESVGYGLGAMVMMINGRDSLELDLLARPPLAMKSTRLESVWWAPGTRVLRSRCKTPRTLKSRELYH